MLERASTRVLPLANRAADHAPMATACCNACRTCVSTNILALVVAGVGGLTAVVVRDVKRFLKR
jgi:hypothetical protein